MAEWKRFFEIPELKHLIEESHGEVLTNEAVQSYVLAKLNKKADAKHEEPEEIDYASAPEGDEDNSDLYYFNKADGCYKVFNPANKTWAQQADKPSQERIQELRNLQDEAKKFIELLKSEISPGIESHEGDEQ